MNVAPIFFTQLASSCIDKVCFKSTRVDYQVKFKAKEVPKHVKQQRFLSILMETEQRKAVARQKAKQKLDVINDEFERSLGRVAGAMSAAMQPFVGTIEDNIMCMQYRLATPAAKA